MPATVYGGIVPARTVQASEKTRILYGHFGVRSFGSRNRHKGFLSFDYFS